MMKIKVVMNELHAGSRGQCLYCRKVKAPVRHSEADFPPQRSCAPRELHICGMVRLTLGTRGLCIHHSHILVAGRDVVFTFHVTN